MPRPHISTAFLTLVVVAGCDFNSYTVASNRGGVTVTLTMSQDGTGNLDCQMPAVCEDLPYGGECQTIEIDVDTATGRACQRCVRSDGTSIDQGCDDGVIGCVVVTLPDPDCVVCAYENGAVVFSTCEAEQPNDCTNYYRSDGMPCERCFDPTGRIIFDSCVPDCSDVVCPTVACGPGTQPWRMPGDCCDQCVPIDACDEVVCPLDYPVPECPPGTGLVRDPIDCCAYVCLPTECPPDEQGYTPPVEVCVTHADCPEYALCIEGMCEYTDNLTGDVCPPGYEWRDDYPYCGQCVQVDDDRYCSSDFECDEGESCVFEGGVCGETTDPDYGDDDTGSPTECLGVCRPTDPRCDDVFPPWDPTFDPCEGEWVVEYDFNGCPYPVCVCFDGSISLDGVCRDQCENVDCIQVVPPDCGDDFYLDYFFPYCCGVCVPLDPCAFAGGETDAPQDVPVVWSCDAVSCAPGYHEEIDAATCCPTCVPDETGVCTSSQDCEYGEYCSVRDGVCNPPPGCEDSGNGGCADVCYGECLPESVPPAGCEDTDGGIAPFEAGVVWLGTNESVADTCTPDGNAVIEMYCSDGTFVQEVIIECDNSAAGTTACVEGACVR